MSVIADLLREMVPLSLVSFGGGTAIIAQLETIAVRQHGWITAQEFLHFFAITRVAPGPGTTLATLIGWKVAGIRGAVVASMAIYAPSTLLCHAVFRWSNGHRDSRWYRILQRGLAPVGIGLVAAGVTSLFRVAGGGWIAPAIAFLVLAILELRPRTGILPLLLMGAGLSVLSQQIGL
ncbi:MAG: chromate transporter [Paracoccus sp. (in: a-proteobacteria)]|uniref:chromate transporter n=1 Tax=Paracoccus sp. TaxID=267 RepID=UPI0039E5AE99